MINFPYAFLADDGNGFFSLRFTHSPSRLAPSLLALFGELDHDSASLLTDVTAQIATRPHTDLELRLDGLTFVSSWGLDAIVNLYETQHRGGGRLSITGLRPRLRRVFHVANCGWMLEQESNGRVAPHAQASPRPAGRLTVSRTMLDVDLAMRRADHPTPNT